VNDNIPYLLNNKYKPKVLKIGFHCPFNQHIAHISDLDLSWIKEGGIEQLHAVTHNCHGTHAVGCGLLSASCILLTLYPAIKN